MKKNILLGFIIIAFSFLFIGNVKGDENNLSELDLFENGNSNANGTNKSPADTTKETADNLKSGKGLGDTSPDNYFTGTDGSTGDRLGCMYKGDSATLKLLCTHSKNDNLACYAYSGTGNISIKSSAKLKEYIIKYKSCPKGVTIKSSTNDKNVRVLFGKPDGEAYNQYNKCLKTKASCWWLDFDYSYACNPSDEACNEKSSSITTERSESPSAEKGKFLAKYKKDDNYTVREVKIDDGCGLFSDKATEYIKIALTYIIIAGVVLTLVLGMWDFIKALIGSEDGGMKKSWKNFLKRVISLAVLIILPSLVAFLLVSLDLTGVNEGSIFCGVVDEK